MFVLCLLYKDGSIEHKVTRRTEGFKKYKMDQRKKWDRKKNPTGGMDVCLL
jgi:hypothetical protein